MSDREPHVEVSRLSGRVTLDGMSVEVQIYRLEGEPQWVLVIVNEFGATTVWDELFPADSEALATFQAALTKDGIASFYANDGSETIH